MMYSIAHIVHLFCAMIFVGGVFFEALILSALHTKKISREVRKETERVISARAVRVMPFVVIGLFGSGLILVQRYTTMFAQELWSSFTIQLGLKIVLAFGVLLHFLIAVTKMRRGTLTVTWSKYIHMAVLIQMILIVLLAKTMFYVSWSFG